MHYLVVVKSTCLTLLRFGFSQVCGSLPPPYFARPASAWWFERHTYLAMQCQSDIQSDTGYDLGNEPAPECSAVFGH